MLLAITYDAETFEEVTEQRSAAPQTFSRRQMRCRLGAVMSEPNDTAPVGYKQPPRHSQFKPGVSGNPRGRPKRKLDISLALNTALNDKVSLPGFGKTMTGMEAFVQSIVDRVLRGESKAIPELVRLFNKVKLFTHVTDPTRLTGVVVKPDALKRDEENGTHGGYYPVENGWLYVDPVTKLTYSS